MNVVWTYKEQTTYVPCFFECVYIKMCRFVIKMQMLSNKTRGKLLCPKSRFENG